MKKTIGVSLQGGGLNSAAYIGCFAALYESGIYPKVLTGASGGSIVAACIATGATPQEILHHFNKFRLFKGLIELGPKHWLRPREGLIKMWLKLINEFQPKVTTFNDLKIKTWLKAVNAKGEIEYLDNGRVDTAIIASAAIPYITGPYERKGKQYYDGAMFPEMDARFLKEKGAEIVICLDVNSYKPKGPLAIFNMMRKSIRDHELNSEPVDMYVQIDIGNRYFLSTSNLSRIYEIGYKTMQENITAIQKLL